jgi:hypothetical protein
VLCVATEIRLYHPRICGVWRIVVEGFFFNLRTSLRIVCTKRFLPIKVLLDTSEVPAYSQNAPLFFSHITSFLINVTGRLKSTETENFKASAPLKLPIRHCFLRLRKIRKKVLKNGCFIVGSILSENRTTVKLPGSFRLAIGNRHLYRYCIFTGLLVETVPKSLNLSCGPELTRQGVTLL